jgi:hypothetical protein
LNIGEVQADIRFRCHGPVFVASLGKTFHDVCFITHKAEETHNFFTASTDSSQHITLFSIFENEHQLIDTVDFIFDILDERSKGIGNVVNESIRYPVRGDIDKVLELLDTPSNILRMGCASKMELYG